VAVAPEVRQLLDEHRIEHEVLHHPEAYTALEEAEVSHVSGHSWAKTVVFLTGEGEPIMAVLPASTAVDPERLEALVGAGLHLADEDAVRRLYPSCEPGGMPPLGNLYGQRVFVDQRLADQDEIVFNAGDHRDAVRMRYDDFFWLTQPTMGRFAAPMRGAPAGS